MEKIVKNGLRDCTVILDGSECAVKFDSCFRAFAVRNDGAADIYISKTSGIVPDDDGVMCIKSGASAVFAHMDIYADTVYLLGNGRVQLHAQNDSANPFNFAPAFDGGVQASGNPVTLDGLQEGVPFSEITVSGDDIVGHELTVNVSGKNLLKYPFANTTKTENGITFTDNGDGSITVNGTATATAYFSLSSNKALPTGKYVLGKSMDNILLYVDKYLDNAFYQRLASSTETIKELIFNVSEEDAQKYTYKFGIQINKGNIADNVTIYPQLEIGSTATPYEPYHGSVTTITPDSNPFIIPNDIRQQDGLNVVSVSEGKISVTGVRKNAASKKLWDEIDKIKTAIIVSNGESE